VLPTKDWVVHIDADIALPPHTRKVLESLKLDPTMIYGIDRHNIVGAALWREHLRKPKIQHEANAYLHTESYPVATRFVTTGYEGYVPIGFFQLWNPKGSKVYTYASVGSGADRSDSNFAIQWPRAKRGFLPEIIGYHLESEKAPQGANWWGRTTIPFNTKPPRWRVFQWWWWKRHHKKHHRHYNDPHAGTL
jgi:hypothetical protein